MKRIFLTILFIAAASLAASAQTDEPKVCISQAAANACRDNAQELAATKAKVTVLENALLEKDKNESDLRERLHKTEVALAQATGELIATKAELTRNTAILQAMLPLLRKKKVGLINLF